MSLSSSSKARLRLFGCAATSARVKDARLPNSWTTGRSPRLVPKGVLSCCSDANKRAISESEMPYVPKSALIRLMSSMDRTPWRMRGTAKSCRPWSLKCCHNWASWFGRSASVIELENCWYIKWAVSSNNDVQKDRKRENKWLQRPVNLKKPRKDHRAAGLHWERTQSGGNNGGITQCQGNMPTKHDISWKKKSSLKTCLQKKNLTERDGSDTWPFFLLQSTADLSGVPHRSDKSSIMGSIDPPKTSMPKIFEQRPFATALKAATRKDPCSCHRSSIHAAASVHRCLGIDQSITSRTSQVS